MSTEQEVSVGDQAVLDAAAAYGYELKENCAVNVGFYFVPVGDRDDAPQTFPTITDAWSHIAERDDLNVSPAP